MDMNWGPNHHMDGSPVRDYTKGVLEDASPWEQWKRLIHLRRETKDEKTKEIEKGTWVMYNIVQYATWLADGRLCRLAESWSLAENLCREGHDSV